MVNNNLIYFFLNEKMNLSQVRNYCGLVGCMENAMTGERVVIRSIAGCSVAPFWS